MSENLAGVAGTERFVSRVGTLPGHSRHAGRPGTGYVVVTLELRTREGEHTTVTHDTVTDPVEVSLTGEHYEPWDHRGEPSSGGQIVDTLGDIVTPAPGWDMGEVRELRTLWERWHLNTMRAACAHMSDLVREDNGYGGTRITCTAGSGYTYGAAWLTEPVPDDVVARLRYLMRDRSDALYLARGYDAFGRAVRQSGGAL